VFKTTLIYLRDVITHLWTIMWSPAQATVADKLVPQDASRAIASSATMTVTLIILLKVLDTISTAVQGLPTDLISPAQIEKLGLTLSVITMIVQLLVRWRQGAAKPPGA